LGRQGHRKDFENNQRKGVTFFLTYNEAPSGIFSSQVIEVVKFLQQNSNKKVRLVSFISLRRFFFNRRSIKNEYPQALVYPMFPKMSNWRSTSYLLLLLCRLYKPQTVIARSVMASKLALVVRDRGLCRKVVYDGRGAIASEWNEYHVVDDLYLLSKIAAFEKEVIQLSDFRISVSRALVSLWKKNYGYLGQEHIVVPCTLSESFVNNQITGEAIRQKRSEMQLSDDDTVFIYSGSLAGWQSFDLTQSFIEPVLKSDKKNKIVFFSPSDSCIHRLMQQFPEQVMLKHLDSNKVHEFLIIGDYGLLIRENSETNKVASPVKYAEYLSSGLKVIISSNLGDYTELSREKNWGVLDSVFKPTMAKPTLDEKLRLSGEAKMMFAKKHYMAEYKKLLNLI
jgi:hypothetical protein